MNSTGFSPRTRDLGGTLEMVTQAISTAAIRTVKTVRARAAGQPGMARPVSGSKPAASSHRRRAKPATPASRGTRGMTMSFLMAHFLSGRRDCSRPAGQAWGAWLARYSS